MRVLLRFLNRRLPIGARPMTWRRRMDTVGKCFGSRQTFVPYGFRSEACLVYLHALDNLLIHHETSLDPDDIKKLNAVRFSIVPK